MPTRSITIDGKRWEVSHSGRVTQYDRDEFGLVFVRRDGDEREVRVTRYSPQGARWREESLAEMSEADLKRLFEHSQPGFTSPEVGYRP
jgi:YD repeat-containing protein